MGYKKVLATLGIVLFMGTGSAYAADVTVEFPEWSWKASNEPYKDKGGYAILPRDELATDIKGNSFIIEDIATGKLIRAIRTGGTNHNDVETVSKEDTATLMSIDNGSWVERAVLVHYNGKVYGASMTTKNHAGCEECKPKVECPHNRSDNFGK